MIQTTFNVEIFKAFQLQHHKGQKGATWGFPALAQNYYYIGTNIKDFPNKHHPSNGCTSFYWNYGIQLGIYGIRGMGLSILKTLAFKRRKLYRRWQRSGTEELSISDRLSLIGLMDNAVILSNDWWAILKLVNHGENNSLAWARKIGYHQA